MTRRRIATTVLVVALATIASILVAGSALLAARLVRDEAIVAQSQWPRAMYGVVR